MSEDDKEGNRGFDVIDLNIPADVYGELPDETKPYAIAVNGHPLNGVLRLSVEVDADMRPEDVKPLRVTIVMWAHLVGKVGVLRENLDLQTKEMADDHSRD